jgi:RecA-family ATPase
VTFKVIDNNDLDVIALRQERKAKFILFGELAADSPKEWLVKGLLGAGEASAVYGVPGCGKSVLVEDLALHVALGWPWHGRPVRRGAVLYLALERKQLVIRRAIAFREHHQVPTAPFAIVGGVFDLRTPQAVTEILGTVKEIEDETAEEVVLIVIDTISRALCGGDENSPKDMGAIVAATSKLQAATRAHVLWVHHMPQDGAERLRGHGALLGAMDTTIHVEKVSGELRTASVVKANDSEEGERVAFKLEGITIAPETTAPIVLPAETPETQAPKENRLHKNHQTMLTLLREAGPAGLNVNDWNEKAREIGLGTSRRTDLYDYRLALKQKRLVHEYAGIWHVSN